jgi:hypothetical protein
MLIDRSEVGRAFQKGRLTLGKRKLRRGVSFNECVCTLRTSATAARCAGVKHGHSKREFSDGSSAAN